MAAITYDRTSGCRITEFERSPIWMERDGLKRRKKRRRAQRAQPAIPHAMRDCPALFRGRARSAATAVPCTPVRAREPRRRWRAFPGAGLARRSTISRKAKLCFELVLPLDRHRRRRCDDDKMIRRRSNSSRATSFTGTRYAVSSQLTKAVRELAERFEHRLFLTATPHNGHSNSFRPCLRCSTRSVSPAGSKSGRRISNPSWCAG